jgi:hypothetical protein
MSSAFNAVIRGFRAGLGSPPAGIGTMVFVRALGIGAGLLFCVGLMLT